MAGRVNQLNPHALPAKADTGCFNGNASPALHREIVRVRGAEIHAPGLPDRPGSEQQLFRQGRFTGIHVGKDSDIHHMHSGRPFPSDNRAKYSMTRLICTVVKDFRALL